jgi:hypothetical protein
MAEHAKWSGEADRRWAAFERLVSEHVRRQEVAYTSYAEASRQEQVWWDEHGRPMPRGKRPPARSR